MGHRLQYSCPEATAIHILDIPGSVLSFDRTAPRRKEHATPWFSWSERYSTSSLQKCGRESFAEAPSCRKTETHPGISRICIAVYPSRIANVDELKTRLIDDWEHFHQSIVDAAISE